MSHRFHSFRIALAAAFVSMVLGACGAAPAAPAASDTPTTTTPSPATGDFFDSTGARISYLIDRPTGSGPFPAIVIGHEGGFVTKGDLAVQAAALTQQGFIVLRYDKRGTGFSTGTFVEVTTENSVQRIGLLAADMAAAVQTLKGISGVNPAKIGLVGVSQAGWIMPLAATLSGDVKFIAVVVGPAVAVGPLYYYAGQATDSSKDSNTLSALLASYTGATGFDPRPSLQQLSIPMIYLMATGDRVVPTRESVAFLNTLIAAGKPISVIEYPGGHELRETTRFSPDLFAWLSLRK
jgi:dienelactone hydrolase